MLLFAAALVLTAGWAYVAEAIANFAYFSLAVGVVLQLVSLGRNRRKTGASTHGSS